MNAQARLLYILRIHYNLIKLYRSRARNLRIIMRYLKKNLQIRRNTEEQIRFFKQEGSNRKIAN